MDAFSSLANGSCNEGAMGRGGGCREGEEPIVA